MFTKSQDSPATSFSNALVSGKSHLKQGGQIVRLIFFIRKFWLPLLEYLQMFALLIKKNKKASLITIG